MFAELKDPVRAKIERYGLTRTIDPHHFFPTIKSAVAAFCQQTGAHWVPAAQTASSQTAADGGQPHDPPGSPPAGSSQRDP